MNFLPLRAISAVASAIVLLSACATVSADSPITSLRLIGEQRIALKQPFNGTLVGGLSGIDYDAASGDWVLESDDRSEFNPARFYRASLNYDSNGFFRRDPEQRAFLQAGRWRQLPEPGARQA